MNLYTNDTTTLKLFPSILHIHSCTDPYDPVNQYVKPIIPSNHTRVDALIAEMYH